MNHTRAVLHAWTQTARRTSLPIDPPFSNQSSRKHLGTPGNARGILATLVRSAEETLVAIYVHRRTACCVHCGQPPRPRRSMGIALTPSPVRLHYDCIITRCKVGHVLIAVDSAHFDISRAGRWQIVASNGWRTTWLLSMWVCSFSHSLYAYKI